MVQVVLDGSREEGLTVSNGYAKVEDVPALQAADMVAHETYRYLTKYIDDPNASPTPHLKSLFQGLFDADMGWYGKAEIQAIADVVRRLVTKIDTSSSGSE